MNGGEISFVSSYVVSFSALGKFMMVAMCLLCILYVQAYIQH